MKTIFPLFAGALSLSLLILACPPYNPGANPTPLASPTPALSPTPTASPTPALSPTPAASPTPTAGPAFLMDVEAVEYYLSAPMPQWYFDGMGIIREEGESGPLSSGANITIGGQTLAEYAYYYAAEGMETIDEGTDVAYRVAYDGVVIEDSLRLPDSVVLTSPASGSTLDYGDPITVSWSTAAADYEFPPEAVRISIVTDYTDSGGGYGVTVPFSDGTVVIPAGTTIEGPVPIAVDALDQSFPANGRLAAGSSLKLANRRTVNIGF